MLFAFTDDEKNISKKVKKILTNKKSFGILHMHIKKVQMIFEN